MTVGLCYCSEVGCQVLGKKAAAGGVHLGHVKHRHVDGLKLEAELDGTQLCDS